MNLELRPISKAEAIQGGLKKYFTGKPCKYGHLSERWTISGKCIQCKTNRDQSGRNDGKKLDPSAINKRSIPMPALDDSKLADLNLVHMDTTGISNESISKAEWMSLAKIVHKVETFRSWIIGDLWNLCEWGSKSNMMESMGINSKTAQEYGRVSARIPHDMRRANLSFSHHQELCVQQIDSEDKMVQYLDIVETRKLSVAKTRSMVKKLQLLIDNDIEIETGSDAVTTFLKSYQRLGKQIKSLDEIPSNLQEKLDDLIFEFTKLGETND